MLELYSRKVRKNVCKPISVSYQRLVSSQKLRDGSVTKESMFETFDFSIINRDFSSSDFSIGNILSVGALQMLQPVSTLSVPAFSAIDSFTRSVTAIPEKD